MLTVATRLEPGCLSCGIWTEPGEDSYLHYEERWRSEEAIRRRVRSDAFTKLLEVLEASPTRPTVAFDFVARRLGLEFIEEVRGLGPPCDSRAEEPDSKPPEILEVPQKSGGVPRR